MSIESGRQGRTSANTDTPPQRGFSLKLRDGGEVNKSTVGLCSHVYWADGKETAESN